LTGRFCQRKYSPHDRTSECGKNWAAAWGVVLTAIRVDFSEVNL
jgi:hypothetical protein